METDRRLVERVLRADPSAFRDLVRLHQRLVWRLVSRMVADEGAREELAQDVFVQVHRRLHGFHFEAKLSTWIAAIAYRRCLNHLSRGRGRTAGAEVEDPEAWLAATPDGAASPLDVLEAGEASAFVRARVYALPPAYRAVITLFHLEEMPLVEIALVLDLPEGTVKSHLFRARKLLKEDLLTHFDKKELFT